MTAEQFEEALAGFRCAMRDHYGTGNYSDLGVRVQDIENEIEAALTVAMHVAAITETTRRSCS